MVNVKLIGISELDKVSFFNEFIKRISKYDCLKTKFDTDGTFSNSFSFFYKSNNHKDNLKDDDLYKELVTFRFNLKNNIYNADIIYIFVNGDYFMSNSREQKCRNIKRHLSRFITPYLSEYVTRNQGKLPLIFFAVTKSFKVLKKNKISEIHSILRETFSSLFDSENKGYQEPYAICIDIEKHYSISIPFLIGIYSLFQESGKTDGKNIIKKVLEKELRIYQNFMITDFRAGTLPISINKPNWHTLPLPSECFGKKILSRLMYSFSKKSEDTSIYKQQKIFMRRIFMTNTERFQTRFTALGMSNSGKTCYVMGMYSEMASGIRGWTVCTANADADRITRQLKIMENGKENGCDRFPAGTQDYEFDDYEFKLYFRNHKIMNFNWIDYAGRILEESGINSDISDKLEESILNSTTLYIFVDGKFFIEGTTKQKIKKVRRGCSDMINPKITQFMKNHENAMPPIVFVITKSDLYNKHTSLDEIKEILKECFSSIFYDENSLAYVTEISLGYELAENDYSGEIEPVNIQTPFFIGIAHDFSKRCEEIMDEIMENIHIKQEAIKRSELAIEEDFSEIQQSEKNIMENSDKIAKNQFEINSKKREIEKRKLEIAELEKEVARQLDNIQSENQKIDSLSSNFIKRIWNKRKIEEAKGNVSSYEQYKKNAVNKADKKKDENSLDESSISRNKLGISLAEMNNDMERDNIDRNKYDIEEQKKIIVNAEKNIAENMEEHKKYLEMLNDVLEELKKQSDDEQFIVIKGGQEIRFSTENIQI